MAGTNIAQGLMGLQTLWPEIGKHTIYGPDTGERYLNYHYSGLNYHMTEAELHTPKGPRAAKLVVMAEEGMLLIGENAHFSVCSDGVMG